MTLLILRDAGRKADSACRMKFNPRVLVDEYSPLFTFCNSQRQRLAGFRSYKG
jgi:hypothetical protein